MFIVNALTVCLEGRSEVIPSDSFPSAPLSDVPESDLLIPGLVYELGLLSWFGEGK